MPDEISLQHYIDTKIDAVQSNVNGLRDMIEQHFALNDKALKMANEAMLARLESMNEFRAQIKEERANLATKDDVITTYDKLNNRLCPLEESRAFSAGRMWMVMAIFAAIPTVLAIIALFT